MALLQDLIRQINDPTLRDRILQETNKLMKQKKFGRKGIVDQADASLFHGDFSFLSANDVELLYRAF